VFCRLYEEFVIYAVVFRQVSFASDSVFPRQLYCTIVPSAFIHLSLTVYNFSQWHLL